MATSWPKEEAAVAPPLESLIEVLRQDPAWSSAWNELQRSGRTVFDNIWGGSRALLAAALHGVRGGSLALVASSDRLAEEWAEELDLFTAAEVVRYPARWQESEAMGPADPENAHRLNCLKRLTSAPSFQGLIVCSIQGLMQPGPSGRELCESARRLKRGDQVDPVELRRWLIEHGFHVTSAVEVPGEAAFRGGLIDVFPLDAPNPIRIEFFDTEIESLREFDVATQRSLAARSQFELLSSKGLDATHHLLDQLPRDCGVMMLDLEEIASSGEAFLQRAEDPSRLFGLAETLARANQHPLILASALNLLSNEHDHRLSIESIERFSGEIGRVRQELDGVGAQGRITLIAQNEAEAQRHRELLADSAAAIEGRLEFVQGYLYQGFRLRGAGRVVLTCRELLAQDHLTRRAAARGAPAKPLEGLHDLTEGDLVVHLAHGIGRYRGLKQLEKDGRVADYVAIEFHGGTTIYVPTARIDLVQKYVGGSKTRPTLSHVGGKSWLRQKKAAEGAATDLAADMLELQAVRAARPGVTCGPDSPWQLEFDAAFPYHETPDQRTAIAAIKSDLESLRPMDRLLCGDVGYGKTEVAMRAIFKAVDNGYQAALMAPTTILAEQHYHSIRDRMAAFPIDIGKLSRFSTAKQQRETLEGVRSGRIDVVVGTHRLASRDVEFNNLGLIIIDEEQRFGVEVKERLKAIRSSVDVLTMSATPIPRTLHMALVGVRDISNLTTPPEDRLPVETRVTRFDAELIRRAVLRELDRDGQIYFVHNRIEDIHGVASQLRELVPEARIGIAHGQMPEAELERVMVSFVHHEFDLLLATTIVESGLDIPTANTIFIDDADRYGLAELHQLRGRVGRYKHRASCYLLLNPRRTITPNAGRRLRAIQEYSEMGAGFAIAMRDLEIRGAGNLLGAQQSGHIAAVGYEFYCQMLENAVRQLKSQPPRLSWDVEIELPGAMHLPDEYINDIRLKIDLYRRLAKLGGFDELEEIEEEMRDRFGPVPAPARRMLEITALKLMATIWQVSAVWIEPPFLALRYSSQRRIEQLRQKSSISLRVADGKTAYAPLPSPQMDPEQIFAFAKLLLQS